MHNTLGWAHRDVKLENVLYSTLRNTFVLGDFGATSPIWENRPGGFGTPIYAPQWAVPEMQSNGVEIGCVYDLYGIMMCIIVLNLKRLPWHESFAQHRFEQFIEEKLNNASCIDTGNFFPKKIEGNDYKAIMLIWGAMSRVYHWKRRTDP